MHLNYKKSKIYHGEFSILSMLVQQLLNHIEEPNFKFGSYNSYYILLIKHWFVDIVFGTHN